MRKKLIFATIASILTLNAFADPVTITTQDYVDTADATKQNKIAARGTGNFDIPMPDSVITDTATDGTIAKRFIIEGDDNGGADGLYLGDNDWLGDQLALGNLAHFLADGNNFQGINETGIKTGVVTIGLLDKAFARRQSITNNKQQKKVCVRYLDGAAQTSENCLLWNLPD